MKKILIKVQVTPGQSRKIQEAVFEKGGGWMDQNTMVIHTDIPFLVIDKGTLFFCHNEASFNEEDVKQVFVRDALELIKMSTSMNPTYIVDVRGSTVAIREKYSPGTNTPVWPTILDRDTPGLVYLWELGNTTRYCKKSNSVVSYTNKYRYSVMEQAHKLCEELNKGNKEEKRRKGGKTHARPIETRTSLKPPYVVDDREDRVAVRENTRTSPSVLDEATPGLIYLWKLGKTTMYNRQEDSTTHYRNEHRHDILASAYKMCDELNQKGA